MLAGKKITETSDGVLGCTFQTHRHPITISGMEVSVWDTAGLDEGTRGRISPQMAEKNLTELLRELRSADGIHLLVYCIRGSSVRKSLARDYDIFYSAICRKKVPIVAVVTGLENATTKMEDWWINGGKELAKYKMRFDDHACVTTIDMEELKGSAFEERSTLSQRLVRELVINNCHHVSTRPPSDTGAFIKAILVDFRSMMGFGGENVRPCCKVVFYQTDDIHFFDSDNFGDLRKINSQINGHPFVFQRAGDLSKRYVAPRMSKVADLLIFAGTMSRPHMEKFCDFYTSCGGEICPLLVVTDHHSVDDWKSHLNNHKICARVVAIPLPSTDGHAQVPKLCNLIEEQCLVRYNKTNRLKFWRKKANVSDETPAPHG